MRRSCIKNNFSVVKLGSLFWRTNGGFMEILLILEEFKILPIHTIKNIL